ncbi:MAG: hypothetical protein HZA52_03130 [Planctomycetes bacterium]|nr:hypothetical protein [Planctomycetota bacterium]
MSFEHHGWSGIDLQRIDSQLQRISLVGRARGRRLSEAQRDLGRVALVTRALSELMIAKGLITKDELLAQIERTDLEDGVADGELAPEAVVPGTKVASKRPSLPSAPPPEVLARARNRVETLHSARPTCAEPVNAELIARAQKRLQAAREKERKASVEARKAPMQSKSELVARARERLKAAKEKERRRSLP